MTASACTLGNDDDERLVEAAHELEQAGGQRAEDLFTEAVRLVAEQKAVHSDDVVRALAGASRDHIDRRPCRRSTRLPGQFVAAGALTSQRF